MKRKTSDIFSESDIERIEEIEAPYYDDLHDSENREIDNLDIIEIENLNLNVQHKHELDLERLTETHFKAILINEMLVRIDGITNEGYLIYDRYTMIPARFLMANPNCGHMRKIGSVIME